LVGFSVAEDHSRAIFPCWFGPWIPTAVHSPFECECDEEHFSSQRELGGPHFRYREGSQRLFLFRRASFFLELRSRHRSFFLVCCSSIFWPKRLSNPSVTSRRHPIFSDAVVPGWRLVSVDVSFCEDYVIKILS